MLITLNCEMQEGGAEVILDLGWDERPPGEQNRRGTCAVRLSLRGWKVEGRFSIDRDILRSFLSQARRMDHELEGTATLHDWGSISEVTLKVLDRGRGIIAVGVKLSQTLFPGRGIPHSADFPFGQELMVTLGGLTTDQSYLPPFLAYFRDFLALADADLEQAAAGGADTAARAKPSNIVLVGAVDYPVPKALRLLLGGIRSHGIALGRRSFLFSTNRLPAGAAKGLAGMVDCSRERGCTLVRSAADWQGLPELFGLLSGPSPAAFTGMVLGDAKFGAAEAAEVADAVRRMDRLSEFLLALRRLDRERDAQRRARLAALGQAAVTLDSTGRVLEIALHPANEWKLQRLANAAADMGLWVSVRTETGLPM